MSIKDGLPSDALKCVIQDHLGFIWVASASGLSKYDGYEFVNYYYNENDTNSAIRSNIVNIMEDSEGDIWAATNGGLSIFLRDEDRFVSYTPEKNNPHSLSDNRIVRLFQDSEGNMWIGTRRGGLNFVKEEFFKNKSTGLKFQHIRLDKSVEGSEWINDILEDIDKNIWVCSNNGLIKISKEKIELIQPIESELYNGANHFRCIVKDSQGIFWIGTDRNGIARFNHSTNVFNFYPFGDRPIHHYSYSPNRIMSLLLNGDEYLFAGPIDGSNTGIIRFNRNTKEYYVFNHNPFDPNSVAYSNVYVRSIIEDNIGNIWFTQNEGKLNIIHKRKNLFQYYRKYTEKRNEIIFSRETRMIETKDGKIWFASENGLFQYWPDENRFEKIEAINQTDECTLNDKCWKIVEDKDGNLWTGGHNQKLRKYNPVTREITCLNKKIKLNNPDIHSILADKSGNMWFGTWMGGVDMFNAKTNKIVNYKFRTKNVEHYVEDMILEICEDSSNSIWIAPNIDQLYKLDKNTGNVKRINFPRGIGFNCDLFVDSKNRLWVGMKMGGIFLFNTEDDSYRRINTDHGLPSNNFVTGFSEDIYGNIYCCTDSYLIKLNKNAQLERYYNIATEDEDLYQTYYIKRTKELYIISDKGFYRFFADSLKPNLLSPKMVLTDIKLMDKSLEINEDSPLKSHINVAKEIVLEHWQHDITIQYAGIHYVSPSENKYKYMLENYDPHWRNAGKKREATYTNLEHGQYTFKVLGSNSDGIWATEPAKLSIIINTPWWLTWWAYLIYVLVFITILWYLYLLQRKRLRIIHDLEMKEFETVKLKEVDQMKSKFFANISHEFRTPLTLIKGPVERLLDNEKVDDPKKIYRMIKRNSERLLNLINELLDLSKLESGKMKLSSQRADIVSFTKGIAMSFESLAEKKDIQISITSSSNLIELYFDKEKMQQILANLLSNAFKFTPNGGKITVNIEEKIIDRNIYIKITDNGIGIPQQELPKIFDRFYQIVNSNAEEIEGTGIGLSLVKELVEIHHGKITVESEEGNLPAGQSADKAGGTAFTLSFPIGSKHLKDEEMIYNDLELKFRDDEDNEALIISTGMEEEKPLILIVEDNKDVRDFIKTILENEYKLYEAEDGEDGYQKAVEYMPDLIVSDIMMPKMSGDNLCAKLKKNQITSHIPIILLTAKSSGEDRINGLEIGADDYLIKPFNDKELLARMNNLIVQRRNLREKYLKEAEIHPTEVAVTSIDKIFIERMIKIVEENISNPVFSVGQLADDIFVSRSQLYRKFSSVLGEKPNDFIRKYRIKRAADLIKQNFGNITDVAYEVGFDSLSYFSRCFKKIYKQSPHEYEKNHLNHKQK
ncbi:MAG: two-component regulator propeller domain-containing protein [Bacteroidota bacterium]